MDESYMKYQECEVRQLLERRSAYEWTKICDDTTKIIYPCGCIAYHTRDCTPGFRINEWNVNCSKCFLNNCNNTRKGE